MSSSNSRRDGSLAVGSTDDHTSSLNFVKADLCTESHPETPGRVLCGTASPPPADLSTNTSRSTSAAYITSLATPRTSPFNKGKATTGRWARKPYKGKYLGLDPDLDLDDFEEIDLHPLPFEDVDEDEEEKEKVCGGLELRLANLAVDAEEYAEADLGLGTLEYYLDEGDEELQYENMDVSDVEVGDGFGQGKGEEEVFFDSKAVRREVEEDR